MFMGHKTKIENTFKQTMAVCCCCLFIKVRKSIWMYECVWNRGVWRIIVAHTFLIKQAHTAQSELVCVSVSVNASKTSLTLLLNTLHHNKLSVIIIALWLA